MAYAQKPKPGLEPYDIGWTYLKMNTIYSRLAESGFCIKAGYIPRPSTPYCDDVLSNSDGIVHQPEVYQFSAYLGGRFGCTEMIDLGCGSGNKLAEISRQFRMVGVDFGENIKRFRESYQGAIGLEHDLSREPLRITDRELIKRSVVVCSDVIEYLPNPVPLLQTIHDLMQDAPVGIITTPERDRVRGPDHFGPPNNDHHVREWNLPEFERLLREVGLNVAFIGLTVNNDRDWAKRTIIAVLRQQGTENIYCAPPDFRVRAFMCAYNEEDVIPETLGYLTEQGVEVHLIDNWSTDRTVERAARFLGRGLHAITKFPPEGPSSTYDWHALLTHVEDLSFRSRANWCIHYDADEIRESPWPQVRLRDALYRVEREGFNAVDHTCVVFHPTTQQPAVDLAIDRFAWFEFGKRPGHFSQIKAWKRPNIRVRLAESGGHSADFLGRRVYPFKFLLRHYPIRSQQQGLMKILADRKPRWNQEERHVRGWHVQYDDIAPGHNFLGDASKLIEFNPDSFYSDFLVERLSGIGADRT